MTCTVVLLGPAGGIEGPLLSDCFEAARTVFAMFAGSTISSACSCVIGLRPLGMSNPPAALLTPPIRAMTPATTASMTGIAIIQPMTGVLAALDAAPAPASAAFAATILPVAPSEASAFFPSTVSWKKSSVVLTAIH